MKEVCRFKMGSSYFFSSLPGYTVKDEDELILMSEWIPEDINVMHLMDGKRDLILMKEMTKKEYIQDAINSGVPMRAGKFLIPEFAIYIGLTLKELETLRPMFDQMDDKHRYEKVIFEAYIANGGWWLTGEQLNNAYTEYLRARK